MITFFIVCYLAANWFKNNLEYLKSILLCFKFIFLQITYNSINYFMTEYLLITNISPLMSMYILIACMVNRYILIKGNTCFFSCVFNWIATHFCPKLVAKKPKLSSVVVGFCLQYLQKALQKYFCRIGQCM